MSDAEARKGRRIMRAFDENTTLCEPCNLSFITHWWKVKGVGDEVGPVWSGARLASCKGTSPECTGALAALQIVHGKRAGRRILNEAVAVERAAMRPEQAGGDLSKTSFKHVVGGQSTILDSVRQLIAENRPEIDALGSMWQKVEQAVRKERGSLKDIAVLYVHTLQLEMLRRAIFRRNHNPADVKTYLEALAEQVASDADAIEEHHAGIRPFFNDGTSPGDEDDWDC